MKIVVPSKSPTSGLIGSFNPTRLDPPTDQTLPLATPVSVSKFVACNVSDRPACNIRLLVTRLRVVMETLPPAMMEPVSVVVRDCSTKSELVPLKNEPLFSKSCAQMAEPPKLITRPRLIKAPQAPPAVTTFVTAATPPERVVERRPFHVKFVVELLVTIVFPDEPLVLAVTVKEWFVNKTAVTHMFAVTFVL